MTLTEFENQCLRLLNEDDDSLILTHMPGTSTTPTITGAQGFIDFYNLAGAEYCRSCFPLHNTATYSISSGQRIVRNGDFAPAVSPSTGEIWSFEEMKLGSSILRRVNADRLRMAGVTALSANGTAKYFAQRGEEVLIGPAPSSGGTLTGAGLALPPLASSGSDSIAWCPEDDIEALEWRVCAMAAERNRDNPEMAARASDFLAMYNERRRLRYAKLDRAIRALHYPSAIPE